MALKTVEFRYMTGLKRTIFRNARLRGSWDTAGRYSDQWTESPMLQEVGEDGCPVFRGTVQLDLDGAGTTFKWGVILDGPQGANFWGVPTEVQDVNSTERYRQFQLQAGGADPQVETYYFTYGRRLGANKYYSGSPTPNLTFAVWAPNAQAIDVVFGRPDNGYIANDGDGIDPARPVVSLQKQDGGIWESAPVADFAGAVGAPYMYRITNAQGSTVYRTDIYSRNQIGKGGTDPGGNHWANTPDDLDGTVSCSVVVDPDTVRLDFQAQPGTQEIRIPTGEFWASEFTPGLVVPRSVDNLVIYELHIGSLGFGKPGPGTLLDALALLDYLVELGVNAVELLPVAEASGVFGWGYGDTHHMLVETSAGGRDQYQHFVRECHRRGIAVIQDVVYNHYDGQAERAEWQYDSTAPEHNIYYWYEGKASDYQDPSGGYVNNGSSGWAPRYWEEIVRQQFISSAAFLAEEMHVDGLRVDLTQAIHRDNTLNVQGGPPLSSANIFGQKLLREWSRTLHMIQPSLMLVAEDHSGWDGVTRPPAGGGLGFDATWYVDFYHNLIGDSDMAGGKARLLKQAGDGGSEALPISQFVGALLASQYDKVVYHESHDEAGNAGGSARTMKVAVNNEAIWGTTRTYAEARSRVVFGISLFSAGTPMFFMAEEIGAQNPFTYNNWFPFREDILGERMGLGSFMYRYYQDLITLSRRLRSVRTGNIVVLHYSDDNRVLVFKRWSRGEEVIIVVSLNNTPFSNGYVIQSDPVGIPDAGWKELFNSDASIYGGSDLGNAGATIQASNGRLEVKIPANGLLVFVKQ